MMFEPGGSEATTMSEISESRREFLKIAGYVAPVVLTLSVMPAHAQSGSGVIERIVHGNNGLGNFEDPPPPGILKQGLNQNDETLVAPGGPGTPGGPDYNQGGPDK
jgi:hypothetical protein